MKFNNTLPISKITFPDYISPKKVKEICEAMKSGKVIIIKGSQKATGKTTVTNILKENGKNAIYLDNNDAIKEYIKKEAKPGDIIVTIGAGDVTKIGDIIKD